MSSASLRMARNSATTFTAQLLSQGLRAVYVILVARYLSEADFGFYSFALSFCLVLTLLATLGMETLVVREIARLRDDETARLARGRTIFGSMLVYEALLSLLIVAALLGVARAWGYTGAREAAFLLLGGGLILRQLGESLMGILRGHERMEYEFVFSVVEGVGLVGLTFLFHALGLGFIAIFLAYGLAYLAQFLVGLAFVQRVFFAPSFTRVRQDMGLFWKAVPVGIARLTNSFGTNAGPLVLPFLRNELEAGVYGAAYQPLKGLFLFTRSLGVGVLPVFSQLYSARDEHSLAGSATASLRLTTICVLPLTMVLLLFPEWVLQVLYADKYVSGAGVLRVLSLVILLTFLNTLLMNLLIAVDRQKVVGLGRTLALLLNVGLILWLTPAWGAMGPALGLLAGEGGLLLLFIAYLTLGLGRFPLRRTILRPLLAALLVSGPAWLLRGYSPWLIVPLGLVAYLGALVLLGALVRSDWDLLVKLGRQVLGLARRGLVFAKGKP